MTKDDVVELFDRNLDAIFAGLEEVQFVEQGHDELVVPRRTSVALCQRLDLASSLGDLVRRTARTRSWQPSEILRM